MIQKFSTSLGTLFGLVLGFIILVYFNETTLFLFALLLSTLFMRHVISNGIKDRDTLLDKSIGVLFALSVAPATKPEVLSDFSNGFVLQTIFSGLFFLIIIKKQPSVIGRISREAKGAIALLGDDILAGFSAGILSAFVWQFYLQFTI